MSAPVIVGGGLAGLSLALSLSPHPVVVIARAMSSGKTSSELAQGGIASAVGPDDAVAFHAQDTLDAGAGLCDPATVRMITSEGPAVIEQLARWGVVFDRMSQGGLNLGLEGAHGRRRIAHANGDSTGASVMTAMVARVRATPSITVIEDAELQEIHMDDTGVCSVLFCQGRDDKAYTLSTRHVILTTGSSCALWRHATVPSLSWGHGLLIAAQAGARLRDLEFVQFHPTALDNGLDPMPLISEALRGEGARLINEKGESFVSELDPRDIVARAIWAQIQNEHAVYLDARVISDLPAHFPTILDSCLKSGLNPREDLIPVRPVAHYHMGGIATDAHGQTNVSGLFACGEAACTGLHGANRLASNSLLEAVVMGGRIADTLRDRSLHEGHVDPTPCDVDTCAYHESAEDVARVRALMTAHVGLRRSQTGLEQAIESLSLMKETSRHAQVGLMVAKAALARRESRGAHDRLDYPELDPQQAISSFVTLHAGDVVVNPEK
ncbi:MAG: L-aspartate oxidase [Alphaproteobacteria bacterium]|nr:L-aspartate oxidase [Alphaproteobacteria bacterium]